MISSIKVIAIDRAVFCCYDEYSYSVHLARSDYNVKNSTGNYRYAVYADV